MKKNTKMKECKHCGNGFLPRRNNQLYCKTSCKTLASYKRNNYKYVSGHYQKDLENTPLQTGAISNQDIINILEKLELKVEAIQNQHTINSTSITNNAIGTVAADLAVYSTKKIFAPNTLPATKGDLIILKQELLELKELLKRKDNNFLFKV